MFHFIADFSVFCLISSFHRTFMFSVFKKQRFSILWCVFLATPSSLKCYVCQDASGLECWENRENGAFLCKTHGLKTWRLEKFSNREFLRWEKVAELFYAPEREKNKQNSSLIRNLLLNSNAQDFWFCETQFCAEKYLNRNLVTQEGAKILFTSKSTCKSPFPNIA